VPLPVLQIRNEQFRAMESANRDRSAAEMKDVLAAEFPIDVALMGPASLTRVVDYGIAQATHWGFERNGEHFQYSALMLMLGSHF